MADLRMGTCSWKYPSWNGLVYSRAKGIDYLAEYSRKYRTVEVDQWFWSLFGADSVSLPRASTVEQYAAAVPADFTFTVKVPNSITLTHFYRRDKSQPLVRNPHFLSIDLFRSFLETLKPLGPRIAVLMFQFEYLNRQKISSQGEFLERLGGFFASAPRETEYALEPRNPQFLDDVYFRFLNEYDLRHVFLQGYYMPDSTGIYWRNRDLVRGLTVIRLHGYGRDEMEKKTGKKWGKIAAPKEEELDRVVKVIEDLLVRGVDTYVNVNNHYEGSAPLTIERLAERLSDPASNAASIHDSEA